jgi:hypothetical protein
MRTGRHALLALAVLPFVLAGCRPAVDLKQVLQIGDVTSGWFDAGIVAGKNKLVPSVTFRLRKTTQASDVSRLSINALFRAADGKESELDNDVFVQNVDFDGDATAPVTIRSENGYTADPPQSRADMLKHSQFRDMHVQIFVKQGASQWIELGRLDVPRALLTQ